MDVQVKVQEMRTRIMALDGDGLDLLFNDAHTHYGWTDQEVSDETLRRAVSLAEMGPTAFNQQPMRLIFIRSKAAKARLAPALSKGNLDKTMAAPATAIVCYDLDFWKHLPEVFPSKDVKPFYADKPEVARENAVRNGTLQAGYFLMAARAVGLDCGPMSGFDKEAVKTEFLQGKNWEVNFLINLGYGDLSKLQPRNPRLGFDRMAEVL